MIERIVRPRHLEGLRGEDAGDWVQHWSANGFCLLPGILQPDEVHTLIALLEGAMAAERELDAHGIRQALTRFPWVRDMANSAAMLAIAKALLGPAARPVKAIIFDKLPGANWKVPPHQDLTISVKQRQDVPGYGPWSVKDGIDHVQPPTAVMQSIVALRLHLDDCPATNGALRVVPGSHRQGRLNPDQVSASKQEQDEVVCAAKAGDVLAMAPLLVHASGPVARPGHRRVIHIEYSALNLPHGLEWYEA